MHRLSGVLAGLGYSLSIFFNTKWEKSLKLSPVLLSLFFTFWKKQFGISCNFKFLATHGAHPLLCLVGCNGQSVFLQVQKLLRFILSFPQIRKQHIPQSHNPLLLFLRLRQYPLQSFPLQIVDNRLQPI